MQNVSHSFFILSKVNVNQYGYASIPITSFFWFLYHLPLFIYTLTSKVPLDIEFMISYIGWWMNILGCQRVMLLNTKFGRSTIFVLCFLLPPMTQASSLTSLSLSFLIYKIEKYTFALQKSENFSFVLFSNAKIKKFNFLIIKWIQSHYVKIIKLDRDKKYRAPLILSTQKQFLLTPYLSSKWYWLPFFWKMASFHIYYFVML